MTYEGGDIFLVDDNLYAYTVHYDINQKGKLAWKCECHTKIRKGIPCSHILKVMVCCEKSIFEEIDKFWLVDLGIVGLYGNKVIDEKDLREIKNNALSKLKAK